MANGKRNRGATIADRYLEEARDSQQQANLFLVNGFQLKVEIMEFDQETILVNHKGIHELVMRSAVAGMYPIETSQNSGNNWWQAYLPAEAVEAKQSSGNGSTE
jgi:RNA chaperone Hfq